MWKLGVSAPSVADGVTTAQQPVSPLQQKSATHLSVSPRERERATTEYRTFMDLVTSDASALFGRGSGTSGELRRISAGVVAVLAAAGLIGLSSTEPAAAQQDAELATYVVADGETMSEIAEDLNVDLAELAKLNGIDELDTVRSGTTLSVPPRNYDGPVIKHKVEAKETLSEIAENYGISTELLQQLNKIEDPNLVVSGSVVKIPDLRAYFEALDADGSPTGIEDTAFVEEEAASSNGAAIDPEDVAAPSDATDEMSEDFTLSDDGRYQIHELDYVVVAGDTLSQIAEAHEVSTDAILEYNNIADPSHVRTDETLIIPIRVPIEHVDQLAAQFEKWAKANDLDPNLMKAIGWQESHWNPEAVSSAGAVGITQIMPATADYISGQLIGTPLSREIAEENIRMGARYVAYLLELSGGNLDVAIASYYQGYTSVQRNGMRGDTQAYVSGVRGYIAQFESGALPDRDLVNSRTS